jgi:hypothetical protein
MGNYIQAGGSINAGGDIIVGDSNQNRSKLLIDCSNEELYAERQHRQKKLTDERKRIFNRIALVLAVAAGGLAIVYLWLYFFENNKELANVCVTLAPLLLGFATLKLREQPTEFELRQQLALKEIQMILKERS